MNASTLFNRSAGPQSSSSSSSPSTTTTSTTANRSGNPQVNTGDSGSNSSSSSPSSSARVTSQSTSGSSSSTTATATPSSTTTNGFNFHFEFPSINLSNLTDTFTSARFSPPNLSTLISSKRSSSTIPSTPGASRNQSPSPSTSTGSNNSSGSRLIMVCENCGTKFHFLKRKKTCSDCSMDYCVNCFPKDNAHDFFPSLRRTRCRRCRIFNMQPLERNALLELRIKDLKWYMDKKRIPHRYCKEKSELVDLILWNADHNRRLYSPASSYPTSPIHSRTASSNASSNDTPNRVPRQETDESWVFVESEELDRSALSNNSNSTNSQNNAAETSNNNNNNNTSADSTSNSLLSSPNSTTTTTNNTNCSNNSSENNNVNNSMPNATTSRSTVQQNEETTSKENISYDSNSSSNFTSEFKPFSIDDLTSEEQIRDLSIRQIKLLLTRNFVDFKGCCEKDELLEKVMRLWRDVNKAKERGSDDLDDDNACKICMEKVIDCVLLECGHVVTCIDCGKRMNECPICRQYVVRAVRIFKS